MFEESMFKSMLSLKNLYKHLSLILGNKSLVFPIVYLTIFVLQNEIDKRKSLSFCNFNQPYQFIDTARIDVCAFFEKRLQSFMFFGL